MSELDKLRWVRLFSPIHIPKTLIEQVKHRKYSVEDFFKNQETTCMLSTKNGPVLNPLNHLYGLVSEDNLVKGVLWMTIEPLSSAIIIQTFSIDKELWHKGKAVKKLADHVKQLKNKLKLDRVWWLTNYPKHSEKHGFKRARSVLMEFTEDDDG